MAVGMAEIRVEAGLRLAREGVAPLGKLIPVVAVKPGFGFLGRLRQIENPGRVEQRFRHGVPLGAVVAERPGPVECFPGEPNQTHDPVAGRHLGIHLQVTVRLD